MSIDAEVYAKALTANRTGRLLPPPLAGQPLAEFLDLPLLRGDESEHAGYVAAAQRPWPGAIAFYSSPEDSGFDLEVLATAPAVMGTLLEDLPAGPVGRMDRANRIVAALDGGELSSVTRLKLLGGANVAAIRNADGHWEVLQFEAAELLAPKTYALSGVLRGLAGTERAMRTPLVAGARFVLLDGAPARVDLAPGEVGLALNWRFGPAARDIGSDAYAARQHTFRGIGLRPLSPVHVRGRRSSGDLAITWIRRTRVGGDSWDGIEVPLGEDSECYEIDILDGADVRRTLTATTSAAVYSAADQIADFGAPPSSVSVHVYQIGAVWGRGEHAEATV